MNKQDFLKLNVDYNSKTWVELGKIAGVSERTIRTWFKQEGLTKNKIFTGPSENAIEIKKLSEEGFSSSQIAKKLNLTVRQVTLSKDHQKNKKQQNLIKIVLTPIEEQVVIGSLLGDGCIDIVNKKRGYHRLAIKHGIKQQDYCLHKRQLLIRISDNFNKKLRLDTRPNWPDSYEISFKTQVNPVFDTYRKNWYSSGTKQVYVPDLYKLTWLGIAIWYMDDGCCEPRGAKFCTNAFNIGSLLEIQKFFTSINLKTTIRKDNTIYIKSESIDYFFQNIAEFIVSSLHYKVRVKGGELQGTPIGSSNAGRSIMQPSLDSNIFEGSTTNERVLMGQ